MLSLIINELKFWRWSWLEAVNKLFFQWFFIRLAKKVEPNKVELGAWLEDILNAHGICIPTYYITTEWGFIFGVLPLTGWLGRYIGPAKYITILRREDI